MLWLCGSRLAWRRTSEFAGVFACFRQRGGEVRSPALHIQKYCGHAFNGEKRCRQSLGKTNPKAAALPAQVPEPGEAQLQAARAQAQPRLREAGPRFERAHAALAVPGSAKPLEANSRQGDLHPPAGFATERAKC